jgi:hypothetical protein
MDPEQEGQGTQGRGEEEEEEVVAGQEAGGGREG